MVDAVFILVLIAAIALALGIWTLIYYRKRKYEPDYYTFFIIGLVWLPLGIATGNSTFWILGAVFFIIGLANKDKWKKKKAWNKLSEKEKKLILLSIFIGLLLLILGMIFYFLVKAGVIG
jgi:vacuolar-type H+-ATPase subunit I/STV1